MKIELISAKEYQRILDIQETYKVLTFNNDGYQYINKVKFTAEEREVNEEVTEILRKSIKGFSEFNNFRDRGDDGIEIRLQYDYNAANGGFSFTGVGYILLDELYHGFKDKG